MLGADNILIKIQTAANMAGVEEAKAGIGGLNLVMAALTAGIGLAVVAGKSFIEINERQQKAHNQLAQAVKITGGNIVSTDAYLQSFISTNRAYLSSQSDVQDSYGSLLRSGVPVTEAQKDLSRATDLAALKGISLTEATDLLVAAEHGRTRGLIDLGITTTKYTDAEGHVIKGGHNMAAVMQEVDDKVRGGRKTLTESEQTWNLLSNDWQDLATKYGPSLIKEMDAIVKDIDKNLPTWEDWLSKVVAVVGQLAAIPGLAHQAGQAAGGGKNRPSLDIGVDERHNPDHPVPSGKYSGGVRWDPRLAKYIWDTTGYTGPSLPGSDIVEPLTGQVINMYTGQVAMDTPGVVPGPPGSRQAVWALGGEHFGGAQSIGSGNHYHFHTHLEGIYAGDGPSLDILTNKIALRLGYATGR